MDRNREARRTPVSTSNGVSRRRHRGSSFRDSPEEEVQMDFHEASKPRDRSILKKDRDRDRDRVRDRDRDRDRDRCSRSKRRRGERQIHGSGRDEVGGDESTDESVNDFEEFDEDEDAAAHIRLITHPNSILMNNHQRKSFPPAKVYKTTPSWKNTDEIIGFSVPRKARSASTKRSHESWIAGNVQSASPARLAVVGASPAVLSPSSSNASARKKTKGSGGKNRGRKSMSKSPHSSNQDEIEFEIAEVLYGLRQNHGAKGETDSTMIDLMKFDCRDSPISSNCNPKISSGVSPPISVVAPKRKRPRQQKCEDEYQPSLLTERVSPLSFSSKLDEEHLHKPLPCSPPISEKTHGSENGVHIPLVDAVNLESYPFSESKPSNQALENHVLSMAEEQEQAEAPPIKKESKPVSSKEILAGFDVGDQGEEKMQFLIDLMAPPPPPPTKSSPEVEINHPPSTVKLHSSSESNNMDFKPQIPTALIDDPAEEAIKKTTPDIGIEAEKRGGKTLKPCVDQRVAETTGSVRPPTASSSAPWTGGAQTAGYAGGVISIESSLQKNQQMLFSKPRPKRCATHCYIASSISSHQKAARANPFWQPLAAPSLFSKPCSVAVVPAGEPAAAVGKGVVSGQEKGPDCGSVFSVRDKPPLQVSGFVDSAPRAPQILLQQAPANILGPAFLFPVSQQHPPSGAGLASPRPSAKPSMNISSISSAPAPSPSPITCPPPPPVVSMSFSYPSAPPNDTQYLAILQNNPYPFAVPPYRGGPHPHPHVLPFFNSPLYSSPVLRAPPPPPSRLLPLPKSRPARPPDQPDSSREDTADSRPPPDKRPKPDLARRPLLDPDLSSADDDKKNAAKSIAFSRQDPPPRPTLHLQKPHPPSAPAPHRGKILTMNPAAVSVFPCPPPPQWKSGSGGRPASSSSQHRGGQISFGGKAAAPATAAPAAPAVSPYPPAGAGVKGGGKGAAAGGRVGTSAMGSPGGFAGKPPIELSKQAWHQAQLFFSGQFGPAPGPGPSAGGGVYYSQRRRSDQTGSGSASSSMLALCSAGPGASDPAKAAALAALAAASKAGGGQFSLGSGFPHAHSGAAGQHQGKSAEQKGE